MHFVKEACNAIRHYDPTRLKEAYRVIQAVRQLLQHKNTITYISSDTDKYDEFRLVHQLYYGGCDSIGRFETDIDTFLQFLEDNAASLCLRSCKSLCRLMATLIAFCHSDSFWRLVDLQTSEIPCQFWVGILQTGSAVAAITKGKFPEILAALAASAIDKSEWVGILKTGSAVTAIAKGKFPDLLGALTASAIDKSEWVGIVLFQKK